MTKYNEYKYNITQTQKIPNNSSQSSEIGWRAKNDKNIGKTPLKASYEGMQRTR